MSILTRNIGADTVTAIGFGCMNLSHAYANPPPPEQGMQLIRRALDIGMTHFDTAALYGFGRNESLVGQALGAGRGRIHLASKCGMTGVDGKRVLDGRPETLRRTLEESLQRLRTDVIDLYYLHRLDKAVPIEDSVGALADLVRAGKIRGIGLSEVSVATLRRAHAVHPITALQSEYSLWSRNPEIGVLEETRRLGIAFVAFSPTARGFLADGVRSPDELGQGDLRRTMPRFQEPHWTSNRDRLLLPYRRLALDAGCTPAQLALAWLLHKAPHVVPLPGTTSVAHLEENRAAMELRLPTALVGRLEALINQRTVSGARYTPEVQQDIDTEEFDPTPA